MNRRQIIYLGLLFISFSLKAQFPDIPNSIIQEAIRLNDSNARTVSQLANWGTAHYKSPEDQVAFFYSWITQHIRYDKDSMYVLNCGDEVLRAERTIQRRSGVCSNFASLFSRLCMQAQIPSVVISGYTGTAKQPGNRDGHSWSAVKMLQRWWLFDPTWDCGFTDRPQFYAVTPEVFIQTHMPFDPLWQLLDPVLTHDDYRRGQFRGSYQNNLLEINRRVDAFLQLDSLHQFQEIRLRMHAIGISHPLQQTWYQYIQMKWSIQAEQFDQLNYQKAVRLLNLVTDSLNQFIELRNQNQLHSGSKKKWLGNFRHWEFQLVLVRELAGQVGIWLPNEQYDTELLLQRQNALLKKLEEQSVYLHQLQ